MAIDEKSIYLVDGGDYQIYCFGYTQARTVTNDIMRRDPWGGIPIVVEPDQPDASFDDRAHLVMFKQHLDKTQ